MSDTDAPAPKPTTKDQLEYLHRRMDALEQDFESAGMEAGNAIRQLEKADMVILGCIVCLTVLAFYATRKIKLPVTP